MGKNYSKITETVLTRIKSNGKKLSLLLHVCCAPCSSYVLEYLSEFFNITLYYYNPNISPKTEYDARFSELERLITLMPEAKGIKTLHCDYEPDEFDRIAKGQENLEEGGARCKDCYRLRLEKTAQVAKENGFDFFTTTLTISPYKNAEWLNEIGGEMAEKYSVDYLFSDFKKKNGYKRSIELSNQYNLYRQDFCGCVYSKIAADKRRLEKNIYNVII